MADKLFPTPEATVQFQMPNEHKDLLDLMDNMIKMKIQQQNEEYKQKRQQYELTQLENEEKRNQFLIENLIQTWGEEPVNKLKSQGFVDAVSLQQYLQQDFTNNYLKQAQKDPSLLTPENLEANRDKLLPDVYNALYNNIISEQKGSVLADLTKDLYRYNWNYDRWVEELQRRGFKTPEEYKAYDFIYNQYQQDMNRRKGTGGGGAGTTTKPATEKEPEAQPISIYNMSKIFKSAGINLEPGYFNDPALNKANVNQVETDLDSAYKAVLDAREGLPSSIYSSDAEGLGLKYEIKTYGEGGDYYMELKNKYNKQAYRIRKDDGKLSQYDPQKGKWIGVKDKGVKAELKTLYNDYWQKLIDYDGAWRNFKRMANQAKEIMDEAKKASKIKKDIKDIYGK
jgi:hypothetical protein